jgi:hypothetical protein
MFCINVGKFERLIRVFVGFLIFYIGVISPLEAQLWGFIGLVPVITGILGWCPLYLPFKINTNT